MATNTIHDIIARWDSDEGKPYSGKLIDLAAYMNGSNGIGCMCAQGQVLHLLGGWDPNHLSYIKQSVADRETAKLLNISLAHSILLRQINDRVDGAPSIVLTAPEKVLGDQAQTVLAFWHYMDNMTSSQLATAGKAAGKAARDAAREAAWHASWDAFRDVARDAAGAVAWTAAGAVARVRCARTASLATARIASRATNEIQGAAIMRQRGQSFFFLKMFGLESPEAIPPLPVDYGVLKQ